MLLIDMKIMQFTIANIYQYMPISSIFHIYFKEIL